MIKLDPTVQYGSFNLIERYKDNDDYNFFKEKFNQFKENIKGFTTHNDTLNLKAGDVISFISGYNSDIEYTSEILGFDADGEAYVLWDCYWFPLDLNKRMTGKLNRYSAECYFKNPDTGEEGWDIQFPEVYAKNRKEASKKMKSLPNFDCFICFDFDQYND